MKSIDQSAHSSDSATSRDEKAPKKSKSYNKPTQMFGELNVFPRTLEHYNVRNTALQKSWYNSNFHLNQGANSFRNKRKPLLRNRLDELRTQTPKNLTGKTISLQSFQRHLLGKDLKTQTSKEGHSLTSGRGFIRNRDRASHHMKNKQRPTTNA